MSLRRLHVLVSGLPPDAASSLPLDGWTPELEVAVRQLETTHAWGRETVRTLMQLLCAKPAEAIRSLPEPLRIPRPWDIDPDQQQAAPPRRKQSSIADIKAFMNQHGGR